MKIYILASGSSGNSIMIEAGKTAVLLDAGLSCRELAKRAAAVGADMSRLAGIVISHEHSDHIKGAPVMAKKYGLPVFLNKSTHEEIIRRRRDWKVAMIEHFETGGSINFNDIEVRTFRVDHDTADPVGFIISWQDLKVGVVTDVGQNTRLLTEMLRGCDALVIEANHDTNLLDAGPYPVELKRRIKGKNGHLSNSQCAELIREVYHPGMSYIVLAHLSDTNNTPILAYNAACRCLSDSLNPTKVIVASQTRPARLKLSKTKRYQEVIS